MARVNDEGIHIEVPASGLIQIATRTLSSAEILDLLNTPIQIIPAPGEGKFVDVMRVVYQFRAGSTPYTCENGGTVKIGIRDGSTARLYETLHSFSFAGWLDAALSSVLSEYQVSIAADEPSVYDNMPIHLAFHPSDPGDPKPILGGNGTLNVSLLYFTVTMG